MFSLKNKRILVGTWATRGDFNPLFALALELHKRGAIVVVSADEEAREWVESEPGIEFLSTGPFPATPLTPKGKVDDLFYHPEMQNMDDFQRLDFVLQKLIPLWYDKDIQCIRSYFSKNSFDLVVTLRANWAVIDVATEASVPIVLVNPTPTPSTLYSLRFPAKFSGLPITMTWPQFLWSLWCHARGLLLVIKFAKAFTKQRKNRGFSRSIQSITTKLRTITTSVPGFTIPEPVPPHFYSVGPLIGETTKEKMQPSLEKWLENKPVVIFVSFGTTASPTAELWEKIISALKQTGYHSLISVRNRTQEISSLIANDSKFLMQHWVPQKLVLQHPSVKLFVSHCGFGSTSEAVYFGKPILAIPFYFDQPDNGARIADLKVGINLNKFTCTTESIYTSIKHLLENNWYKSNAEKMSLVMRTAGGVKRAVDICEEELFCGSSHLHITLPPLFYPLLKFFLLCLVLCVSIFLLK